MTLRVRTRVLLGVAIPMFLAVAVALLVTQSVAQLRSDVVAGTATQADLERGIGQLTQLVTIGGAAIAVASLASGGVVAWQIGRDIDRTAERLAASSAEVAKLLQNQDKQTSAQARTATDAAGSMSRVAESARTFGEEAVHAAEFAGEALAMSEAGSKALDGMVASLEALRQKAAEVSAETERLDRHTAEIGNITLIVGDLANRTTMLALNAAAEAARAGEHGKGFTNVAADVRKLADESQRSADRIAMLVKQICESTRETVALTEQEKETLRIALDLSVQTERQFTGIAAMLHESHKGAESISRTAEKQYASIRRVFTSIEAVQRSAKATAQDIHAAQQSVGSVHTATLRLKEMV